jgi:hypothetical protein
MHHVQKRDGSPAPNGLVESSASRNGSVHLSSTGLNHPLALPGEISEPQRWQPGWPESNETVVAIGWLNAYYERYPAHRACGDPTSFVSASAVLFTAVIVNSDDDAFVAAITRLPLAFVQVVLRQARACDIWHDPLAQEFRQIAGGDRDHRLFALVHPLVFLLMEGLLDAVTVDEIRALDRLREGILYGGTPVWGNLRCFGTSWVSVDGSSRGSGLSNASSG